MTTTIFRKNGDKACIASDSRITWIDQNEGLVTKWFDSTVFYKTLTIDDVMYGFAGTNVMFRVFLENYTTKDKSEFVLDTVVDLAKKYQVQFFIIRYDEVGLKLFAYSPPSDDHNPEIYRISSDPLLDTNMFAIGSGKHSKSYKKNKHNPNAQMPIYRIINANKMGLRKKGMLDLNEKVKTGLLTSEESRQAFQACLSKGGDLFTGGEVNMSQNATKQQIDDQVAVMVRMDQQAKAGGAVCASPVDAKLEVSQLNSIGQYAVSPNQVASSSERHELIDKMEASLVSAI